MRRAPILAAVTAVLGLLAACDRQDAGASSAPPVDITVKGDGGGDVKMTAGAAEPNLPADVPLYPGASVISNISVQGSESGATIFQVKAAPAAVVDFYRRKAAAARLSETTDFRAGERLMFSAAKPGGGRAISVVATAQDGGAQVQLTWTEPKPG